MTELEKLSSMIVRQIQIGLALAVHGRSDPTLDADELDFLAGYVLAFSDVFVQAGLGERGSIEDSVAVSQSVLNGLVDPRAAHGCAETIRGFIAARCFAVPFDTGMSFGTEDVNDRIAAAGNSNRPAIPGARKLLEYFKGRNAGNDLL